MEDKLKTGTTTCGVIGRDCVVLAADKRASLGHIAYDEDSQKLYKITDNIAATNAGSVGDSLTIVRFLRSQARLYEMEREMPMSVKGMATMLSNVLNSNRYYPFQAQFVIGGVNHDVELYELTPFGDMIERKKYAVSGSGTEPALTTLDLGYKEGMTEQEAVRLAISAVESGKRRDVFSGGKGVSVMVVSKAGVKTLDSREIEKHAQQSAKVS